MSSNDEAKTPEKKKRKRNCNFNSDLAKQFPFITESNIEGKLKCEKCGAIFAISHGGMILYILFIVFIIFSYFNRKK